jgi:hypothetical protein
VSVRAAGSGAGGDIVIGGNYTPAPWHIDIHADGRGATIYALRDCVWLGQPSVENCWQAQVTGDGRNITSPEQVLSVAHKMWAASDLLDALKRLLEFVEAHTATGEVIPSHTVEHVRSRAAIAKASGDVL